MTDATEATESQEAPSTAPPTTNANVRALLGVQAKGRSPKLAVADFGLAEHILTQHVVKAEAGLTLDDVMRPQYWSHVAAQLKPMSLIHVYSKDGSFYALLTVRHCTRIEAIVEPVLVKEFKALERLAQSEGREFITRYGSAASGWQVLRAADKQLVKDGFDTERQAQEWLDGHLKALAA